MPRSATVDQGQWPRATPGEAGGDRQGHPGLPRLQAVMAVAGCVHWIGDVSSLQKGGELWNVGQRPSPHPGDLLLEQGGCGGENGL
eukprot:g24362.t1